MEIHITCGNNLPDTDKKLLTEVVVSGITSFVIIEINSLDQDELLIYERFESFIDNKNLYVIENSPYNLSVNIISPNITNNDIVNIDYNVLSNTDKDILSSVYELILSKFS